MDGRSFHPQPRATDGESGDRFAREFSGPVMQNENLSTVVHTPGICRVSQQGYRPPQSSGSCPMLIETPCFSVDRPSWQKNGALSQKLSTFRGLKRRNLVGLALFQ